MRSYNQYCSVAKSLDVIGDRWNLLIVRELLLTERRRYTDLLGGLPGIATNLLSDRLRDLEHQGILEREQAPPPIATTLYRLTDRGRALEPVIAELGKWGVPLMGKRAEDDAFRSHWLAFPVELFLADSDPDSPPVSIEVRAGDGPVSIEAGHGRLRTVGAAAPDADLVIDASPELVLAVLSGNVTLAQARRRGLSYRGDADVLARLQRHRTLAAGTTLTAPARFAR